MVQDSDYFVYDPNAQLAIHPIYDERQQESEQRREHITQPEAESTGYGKIKQQLDQIEQEHAEDLKQQQLNFRFKQYFQNNKSKVNQQI